MAIPRLIHGGITSRPYSQLNLLMPWTNVHTPSDTRRDNKPALQSTHSPYALNQCPYPGWYPAGWPDGLAVSAVSLYYVRLGSAGTSTITHTRHDLIATIKGQVPGPPLRPHGHYWWLHNCLSTLRRARLSQLWDWHPPAPTLALVTTLLFSWPSPPGLNLRTLV